MPGRHPDAAPTRTTARIETELGDIIDGEILDFSIAGMTIRAPKASPPLGSWVRIGGVYGRVARRIEDGFAVDFEPKGIARYRSINPVQTS